MSEEILGILPAKQGTIVFTSHRLVIQEKGILARLSDGPISTLSLLALQKEVRDSTDAQKRVLEFSQLPVERLLADKKSLVLSYPDISKVEVSTPEVGEQGLKFFVRTDGKEKKHQFNFIDQYLALSWKLLSTTLQGKVIFPQGGVLQEVLNSESQVLAEDYCGYLRNLGIKADIVSLSSVNYVAALIKLEGQSISHIFRDYQIFIPGTATLYIVEDMKGKLDKTKTKRRGKGEQLDFEWVGDKRLSNILNQDSILKNSILQLMSQNRIKDIYINEFKDEDIKLVAHNPLQVMYEGKFISFHSEPGTAYPCLPSKEHLEAMNDIAYHIRSLLQ